MTRFRPGDRVVCQSIKCPVFQGKAGVVEGYDHMVAPAPVLVRFDFWSRGLCHFNEADLVNLAAATCLVCPRRGHLDCDATCPDWPGEVGR